MHAQYVYPSIEYVLATAHYPEAFRKEARQHPTFFPAPPVQLFHVASGHIPIFVPLYGQRRKDGKTTTTTPYPYPRFKHFVIPKHVMNKPSEGGPRVITSEEATASRSVETTSATDAAQALQGDADPSSESESEYPAEHDIELLTSMIPSLSSSVQASKFESASASSVASSSSPNKQKRVDEVLLTYTEQEQDGRQSSTEAPPTVDAIPDSKGKKKQIETSDNEMFLHIQVYPSKGIQVE